MVGGASFQSFAHSEKLLSFLLSYDYSEAMSPVWPGESCVSLNTASQQVGPVCFCSCQVKIITNASDFLLVHLYAYTPASPNTDVPQLQICWQWRYSTYRICSAFG